MRLRIADRILVALAGLLLLACCGGIVAQMFFGVNLVDIAARAFSSEKLEIRAALIASAAILLALGLYCLLVLFRHRKRKDKFILQKNDGGELAISIKALENMVQKCIDQHEELEVKNLYLENRKDGLLIRIRAAVAGGISIPLTVEDLQKQIRQYVTACSGVEVKGIRVQIESSGEDAKNAPFVIAAPVARPLLHEAEKQAQPEAALEAAPVPEVAPAQPQREEAARVTPPPPIPEEDDDRPLHQRLFSPPPEPCIVPEPPAEAATEQAAEAAEGATDTVKEVKEAAEEAAAGAESAAAETAETAWEATDEATANVEDADGETRGQADPGFLESLKAFDRAVTGGKDEAS